MIKARLSGAAGHLGAAGPGPVRLRRRFPGRGLLVGVVVVVSAWVAGVPVAPGWAVDGPNADANPGQVIVYENGQFDGSGTLVSRDWVLLTAHQLDHPGTPSAYTIRFGTVTGSSDPHDRTNLRTIDRFASPERGGDIVLAHLAEPVPEGTVIVHDLASAAPARGTMATLAGWGPDGTVLRYGTGTVYDPVARENADMSRSENPRFGEFFPVGIEPMILNLVTQSGDSGSGVFGADGSLIGVHSGAGSYQHVNGTGNFYGPAYVLPYELPVWVFRRWIQRVISGEGSSSSAPPSGGSPRRRLDDVGGARGDLPMTSPPPTSVCLPGMRSCTSPIGEPGVLLGAGNYRGTALARCGSVGSSGCSFKGTVYAGGASARMSLGPATAPLAPGTREVQVWCATTTPFPEATSPARSVVRVSFTNAEHSTVQIGYGWWDVTPDQLGASPTDQSPLDTSRLAHC
ncbi:MAG TPA: trypsin-like serine protease [Kineosporiaceae bacterium]